MATDTPLTLTNDALWAAHLRLTEVYGTQDIYGRTDPMHELIATILSHRTTHANEVAAFKAMRARFVTWEAVRDAPLEELTDCIKTANYPEVKAPWIKQVLAAIIAERGQANIDFLESMTTEEAMTWLTNLPGVGLKTASLLLLFYFRKPVLPVDTHVHRVTQRVGVLGPKVSAERAHKILLEQLPKDPLVLFNFHKHFYWHGQRTCTWYNPKCNECALADQCAFYQSGWTLKLSSTPSKDSGSRVSKKGASS
jgi:endonuclease III